MAGGVHHEKSPAQRPILSGTSAKAAAARGWEGHGRELAQNGTVFEAANWGFGVPDRPEVGDVADFGAGETPVIRVP